jgi:methionine-rich copper-binding protein CopC
MKSSILTTVGAMLLLSASFALAHTAATTSPKSGAVLTQSPPVIEIKFEHEASLTSVVLVETGKADHKLEFTPKGSAKVFTVANANLPAGRNEIQWKALSKDGHVVSGSIILVVNSAPQKSN